MKKIFLFLLVPVLIFCSPEMGHTEFVKNKIAVLDFMLQGKGFETEDLGEIVAEWLITALVKDGRFDVIERRMLKKIIAEQQLSETGLLDQETTAQLGKVLGVKEIVSGSVMRIQDVIEVNARIIDVESGSILAAENVKNADASQLKDLVEQMALKIIKAFPLEGYIVNRKEDRITIDLGRINGVKPGMEFIVYKEGDVIKHPKTGEVLDVQKNRIGFIQIRNVLDKLSEGYVIKETEPKAIQYGQLVKSTSKEVTGRHETWSPKDEPLPRDNQIPPGVLFIATVPADARIKILNIKPKYYQGINLDPGKYHIEVTAPSYQRKTVWINLLPGERKNVPITLVKAEVKKEPQVKVDRSKPTEPAKIKTASGITLKSSSEKKLALAIFPWQLIDEKHWDEDLSRAKLVRALIDAAGQYPQIQVKYSYYPYDESQNIKPEVIDDVIKFGNRGIWKGKGVSVNPHLNNILNYSQKINADLVLMGNLLFWDIDGQPDSSQYKLSLYLINTHTGRIEKKTGYFTDRNSVKRIGEIAIEVIGTHGNNQGTASRTQKAVSTLKTDQGNRIKLAIFPWKPTHQYWNKEVMDGIKRSVADHEEVYLAFSFYESKPKSYPVLNPDELWDITWSGTKPRINQVRTAAERIDADAVLMCHVKIHDMDPPTGDVTMFLVELADGKLHKVNGQTDQFDSYGTELSIELIDKLFRKIK